MAELTWLRQFQATAPGHPWQTVGPGDDCAIYRWPTDSGLAFKTDQVVERVHFVLSGENAATPWQIGWKGVARTLSDLAAMGYQPVAVLASLSLPDYAKTDSFVAGVHQGIVACCAEYGAALAGGDLACGGAEVHLTTSAIGQGPLANPWLRSGAKPGAALLVTGYLGGAWQTGRDLGFRPKLKEANWLRKEYPESILACIDITDGLARDLNHICTASGCGAVLDEAAIPIHPDVSVISTESGKARIKHALSDGEDYQLLLAAYPTQVERILARWPFEDPLTRIGEFTEGGLFLLRKDGSFEPLENVGYEHG